MKKMEVAIATPRVKKLSNGHNTNVKTLPDINSRTFTTRLTPRYLTIPQLPKGLPEPKFSESAEKILKERYLLKGGNLEVVETIAERFWHVSYDLASAGFDFKEKENAVYQKAIKFYQMMVSQEFMPNSPTVMNAGKQNGLQYSACFVLPIEDSLPDIFDTMKNAALIHQSGGGCISADARVWTTFCGIEPIEVLFARATADGRKGIKQGFGEAFDVSDLGIKTASMNPQTGETGLKAVSHVWKYNVPAKQQVVVTTVEGTEIQTSSWHPFMILRGTEMMEISAEQLISGDIVLGPSNPDQYWPWNKQKTVGSLEITPELGWLIGFTLSDGSFGYVPALRQYRVRWFSGISDVLERVQKILSSHNIKVSIQKDRRGLLSVSTLNQRFVHDLLEACGLEKFGPKDSLIRIPEIVAKSPLKIIRAFLAGLLDGDGYVASDGSPSYSTVSQVMSEDLAALVSLLGFFPSIFVKDPRGKGKKITYTVQLCPLPQVNKLAEQILPFVNSNLRKDRLKSLSKKGTALPLDFHAWRDCLAGLKLVNTRGDKKNGSGPFAKELNNWAAHGRINREDIQTIANGLRKSDLKLSQFLYQVAISGHEIKKVVTATTEKTYYDLSVEEWNTYAAGQSGMLMVHNTGFSFSKIRPNGSRVKRSGGVASGPVSFLKVFNSATESIKQGGTRRGANMGILRVNHPDILEFIRCKSELDYTNQPVFNAIASTLPDDEARAAFKTMLLDGQISNFNISVAITDQFMEAYGKGEKYDLINPYNGEVTGQLDAREVFNEIIDRAWQTGDPGVVFIDRINNTPSNPVRELETIEATNPCVTADTWVHTSDGPKQVADLIGIPFMALVNGQNYLSDYQGFFKTGTKNIIRLQTKGGYALRVTAEHSVRKIVRSTRYKTESGWCEAGKLQVGDKVMLHSHGNVHWSGKYTFNEGYLLGLLVGDGTLKKDKAVLSVWDQMPSKSQAVGMGVSSIMSAVMQATAILPHRSDFVGWLPVSGRGEYRLSLAYIKNLAQELGLKPGSKIITSDLEQTSSRFYEGFLRGLFDADGSIQGTQAKGVSLRLSQSNLGQLEAVQRMLLRLGIGSKIYKNRRVEGLKMLPNGKGGSQQYHIKSQHELVISGDNLIRFDERIGFSDSNKTSRLRFLLNSYKRTLNKERFVAVVDSITEDGCEDVYDVAIPGINAFDANGFYVHNCGEQPLAPWDSCNLGSINLGRFIKENKEVDWDKLRETTHLAVELLDDVVQVNPFNLEPIYDQVHLNRRIGLGVMGWSDMLFKMKTSYDCEEALALAEEVMGFINREGHLASQKLAQERGAFPNWPFSIYKDDKPLRNATISTIAPTGTISIISDCSSGVEPVFALAYLHKAKGVGDQVRTLTIANQTFSEIAQKEGFYSESLAQKVMDHGSVYGIEEVPTDWQKVFVTASEIGYPWHVKMQAAFQKYTDNGVSKTVNLSNSASKDDIANAYLLAWETGCKGITVYRDGSKSIQVLNISSSLKPKETSTEVIGVSEVENNKLVDSRPVVLRGRTYKMATPVGEAFVTVNRDEKNEPFEIFITIGKAGMHTAADAEAIGRMISLALRISRGNRREIAQKIVSHLGGIGGSSQIGFGKNRVMSLADAISKALAEELAQIEGSGESIPLNLTITDSAVLQLQLEPTVALREKSGKIADFCPECGQATFIFEEGCKKCHSCGYSAC